jgi:Zn ribbon nucleic-acid-binding protein
MRVATENEAPRRVSVNGARDRNRDHPITGAVCVKPAARFRCCRCGRAVDRLAVLAEGFISLGWCVACERENRQPELELAKAVTK